METVTIYTDGSRVGRTTKGSKGYGPGGWAALLMCNGSRRELRGGDDNTTCNRMELTAVIMALEALTRRCKVVLYTDSLYTKTVIGGCKVNKNQDLVYKLWSLVALHQVEVIHVKGHAGNELNETVDYMAREEARKRQ